MVSTDGSTLYSGSQDFTIKASLPRPLPAPRVIPVCMQEWSIYNFLKCVATLRGHKVRVCASLPDDNKRGIYMLPCGRQVFCR